LRAGGVAEGGAGVLVGTLGTEGHAASHFGVGPNLALERLNLEDFVLEQHLVFSYSFLDGLVLAGQGTDGFLLASLVLGLELLVTV